MRLPLSDVPAFQRDPLSLFLDRAATADGGLAPLRLGLSPIHLVTDPGLARDVLKWDASAVDKGRLVGKLRPIVGDSLLTNVGTAHRRSKEAIHRHLQRNAVAGNLEKMVAIINGHLSRIVAEGSHDTGENAALALQLGCTALFGHDVLNGADRTALIEAVQVVEAELAADMFRVVPAWPWAAAARKRRLDEARRIVDLVVKRARRSENCSALLTALEEAGLSDEEINAEILGLLIAGHHTTGASISWLLYHMAADPAIAEMIGAEADQVLDDLEAGDGNALRKAPLSLAYVKEILRLYPAGWWTSREVKTPIVLAGEKLRRGETLVVSPWVLHRHPRYWVEPDELSLDRDFTHPAYMPFGVGGRSCIGMAIAWFELQLITLQFASALRLGLPRPDFAPAPHPSVTLLAPHMRLTATVRADEAFSEEIAA